MAVIWFDGDDAEKCKKGLKSFASGPAKAREMAIKKSYDIKWQPFLVFFGVVVVLDGTDGIIFKSCGSHAALRLFLLLFSSVQFH